MAVYDILPTENLKWDDIRDTLNSSGGSVNNDAVTAFKSSSGINKWSRHKPINHPTLFTLSEDEFVGANEDKLQGIFYGLKGANNLKLNELHNANYEYVGLPKGGSGSPYRLGDFRGYAKYAKPNLIGYLDTTTIDWSAPSSFRVRLDVDTTGSNTTGVDISKFLSLEGNLTFENAYPCVLVDGYARALRNESTGSFTTIKYNGTWYSRFIAPDFPSALQVDKERTVTIFLTQHINGENGSINFANSWQDVSQLGSTYSGVTVPECIGLNCVFKRDLPYKPFEVDQFSNVTQIGFNVSFRFTDGLPDTNLTYEIRVSSTDINVPYITNWQYTVGGQTNPSLSFTWAQLGLIAMPSSSEEVEVEIWYNVSSVEKYLISSRVETLKIA